jgi:precorrin-6A/cobalt-precorrin-6A reductase
VKVLLLAGTAEAAQLARSLAGDARVELVASLAGHTSAPSSLPCRVRTGGFGGIAGLERELRDGGYQAIVDATHPFAVRMPAQAVQAAASAAVPYVRVLRPPWSRRPGDDWHVVADLDGAAARLRELGARRVLLTTGRLELAPFASLRDVHLVVRSIEPLGPVPLPDATVVLARGPFTEVAERALLAAHAIDTLVTKDSGGSTAKLDAARAAGVRVVMVQRPPCPDADYVCSADEARRWLDRMLTRNA